MAEGYLPRSATNTEGLDYEALLYCKTNIAGFFFDGFLEVGLSSDLEITSNPVETGASIADHAYVKPREITMSIMMSDVHQSLIPGQFDGGWSRSVKALDLLRELQASRVPFSILCRFGLFDNMLISSISASDDADTYQALRAQVKLVEIPMARVKTVQISAASQTTIATEMGKLQPVNTTEDENRSILKQLYNSFTGG